MTGSRPEPEPNHQGRVPYGFDVPRTQPNAPAPQPPVSPEPSPSAAGSDPRGTPDQSGAPGQGGAHGQNPVPGQNPASGQTGAHGQSGGPEQPPAATGADELPAPQPPPETETAGPVANSIAGSARAGLEDTVVGGIPPVRHEESTQDVPGGGFPPAGTPVPLPAEAVNPVGPVSPGDLPPADLPPADLSTAGLPPEGTAPADDPAPVGLPAAEAPAEEQAPTMPRRDRRTRLGVWIDADLGQRVAAAFEATRSDEGRLSFPEYLESLLTHDVERLERRYNAGHTFPGSELTADTPGADGQYVVWARRERDGWELSIGAAGTTRSPTLDGAETMARHYLSALYDRPADAFAIEVVPELEAGLEQEIQQVRTALDEAREAHRSLIRRLRELGIPDRDIDTVLATAPRTDFR